MSDSASSYASEMAGTWRNLPHSRNVGIKYHVRSEIDAEDGNSSEGKGNAEDDVNEEGRDLKEYFMILHLVINLTSGMLEVSV